MKGFRPGLISLSNILLCLHHRTISNTQTAVTPKIISFILIPKYKNGDSPKAQTFCNVYENNIIKLSFLLRLFRKLKITYYLHHSFYHFATTSGTRLGGFCNFLATNFITKVTQMFGDFFGELWKQLFFKSNWLGYFLATFGKTLATFYFNIWSHCSEDSLKFAAN